MTLGFEKVDSGFFKHVYGLRELLSQVLLDAGAENWGAGCGFGAMDTGGDYNGVHYECTISECAMHDDNGENHVEYLLATADDSEDLGMFRKFATALAKHIRQEGWQIKDYRDIGDWNDGAMDLYLAKDGHCCAITIGAEKEDV